MPDFDSYPAEQSSRRTINTSWIRRVGGFTVHLSAMAAVLLLGGTVIQAPNCKTTARRAAQEPPETRKVEPKIPPATKATERSVAAALYWLAHHQMPDGRWSLQEYTDQCKDQSCTGRGIMKSDAAATALGVLPLLAAGQTQLAQGPFQRNLTSGIYWLIAHQAADGDLSNGSKRQMYAHGLASIALCECFGMTSDKPVGDAAQRAVKFIEAAQNKKSGGWGDHSGGEGDTLTFCWQIQALRSAQLAGLAVKSETLDAARKWLRSVAKTGTDGTENGQFSDKPADPAALAASAAGLLCLQLMRESRTAPAIVAGVKHLMENLPDPKVPDHLYWYFATQVMHNMADKDWDTWNRQMRKTLVASQVRQDCASGSWDRDKPPGDAWAKDGGRVATTSLSCLTLEIYYRYLPLFKLDRPAEQKPADVGPGKEKSDADK